MALMVVICFAAFAAGATAQCTLPAMIQNSVFRSSSIDTWTFQTSSYQYADQFGTQINVTCDGMNGDYYFGRMQTTMASGMEMYGCLKYEWLALGVFRFLEYSKTEAVNVTVGTAMPATYMSACNMSASHVITPGKRFTAVKQGVTVRGNSCPSGVSGMYNYTLDPMGANHCAMTNDKFMSCGNEICFDTTNCANAQSTFGTNSSSPQKKFQCMKEDMGMGGLNYVTVVDAVNGFAGCVAYKKTGMWLKSTYREGMCSDNQTETWVDQFGRAQSMYMLEACSSAAGVLPGLLSFVSVLLFKLF